MKKFILLASLLLGSFAFGISKELDFTAESTYCENPDYRYAKYRKLKSADEGKFFI